MSEDDAHASTTYTVYFMYMYVCIRRMPNEQKFHNVNTFRGKTHDDGPDKNRIYGWNVAKRQEHKSVRSEDESEEFSEKLHYGLTMVGKKLSQTNFISIFNNKYKTSHCFLIKIAAHANSNNTIKCLE